MSTDEADLNHDAGRAPDESSETRRAIAPAKRDGGRWAPWVLVALTLLAMGRVVTNGFSGFDDEHTIWANKRLNPPQFTGDGALWYWSNPHMSLWAPVTYTSWAALAKATYVEAADADGVHVDPRAFHATSLVGHVGGVLLVYVILRRLVRQPWAAAGGAMLYAVHPLQVEAVAWASGLKDVLAATFSLGALACYLKAVDERDVLPAVDGADGAGMTPVAPSQRIAWHALGLLCLAVALLSKPSAMVTPLLAAVIDQGMLRRPARRVALAVLPYALLVVPVAIVAKLVQSGAGVPSLTVWERPVLAAGSLSFYLWKLVAPVGLAFDYGWRPSVVIGRTWFWAMAVASVVILVGLWMTRRRWPGVWTGALVFVAALLPVLGFVTFTFQFHSTVGDHYVYLAMLGPSLAVAWGLARLHRRRIAAAVCTIAGLAWGALSVVQLGTWRDPVTNLERSIAVAQCSALASTNLGHIYAQRGDVGNAERAFRAAADCNPDYTIPHGNLLRIYAAQGRADDAIREFHELQRAGALLPPEQRETFPPDMFLKAGQQAARAGDFRNAERYFDEAARTNPSDPRGKQALDQVRAILSGAAPKPPVPK